MSSQFTQGLESHIKEGEGAGTWYADKVNFATGCVHAGHCPDARSGSILTPIYQMTTFVQDSLETYAAKGFTYSRSQNPSVADVEKRVAAAEGAFGCAAFGTGMAACCTLFMSLANQGDHAIVTNCSYGGTYRAANEFFTKFGIETTFVDQRDVKNIEAAIKPNTKFVLTECPSNPTLFLADLPAVSALCKAKKLVHVCDSTMATPVLMRPVADFGVDMLLISGTKFYEGQNISTAGFVVSCNEELHKRVKHTQNILGNMMTPQVAFYVAQSIKTMPLRVKQQCENAMKVAKFLEAHPKVARVGYPGLESHEQHELAKKLFRGGMFGALLYFEVKQCSYPDQAEAGKAVMSAIQKPFSLCENLGSTESLITQPWTMTHAQVPRDFMLNTLKVGPGFIRVSIGIEDADDLIGSLKKTLDNLK